MTQMTVNKEAEMKVEVSAAQLRDAVAVAAPIAPGGASLPVLNNALIKVRKRDFRVSTTDLDITVRVPVRGSKVEEVGSILVPAKVLLEVLKRFPDESVRLEATEKVLTLVGETDRYELQALPAEEFPNPPSVKFNRNGGMPAVALREILARTIFAVSAEESRPTLNGALFEFSTSVLTVVGTDGHRLARSRIRGVTFPAGQMLVPSASLTKLERILKKRDSEVEIGKNGDYAGFRVDGIEFLVRLIEGKYPDYRQVIPKESTKTLRIKRLALLSAVERLLPIVSNQTHRMRFAFGKDGMVASAMTPDTGSAEIQLEGEYKGKKLEIGFNAKYLIEILKRMPTDEITVQMIAPERAVVIEPVLTGDGDRIDYMAIVMPLRLLD